MFNLEKSTNVVFNLLKAAGIDQYPSKSIGVLDISDSMSSMYARGFVQDVVNRLTPMALAMTATGEMEIYVFHNRCFRVFPNLTKDNYKDYVQRYILSKFSFGGTNYAPAIDMIVDNFMTDTDNVTVTTEVKKKGFNLWPFSKKEDAPTIRTLANVPTHVMFFTDGDAQDPSQAEQAIIRASNHAIFWQKVGMKVHRGAQFQLLKKIDTMEGRFVDNANFFEATTEEIVDAADEVFYGKLLAEYPEWIKKVQDLGILKKA